MQSICKKAYKISGIIGLYILTILLFGVANNNGMASATGGVAGGFATHGSGGCGSWSVGGVGQDTCSGAFFKRYNVGEGAEYSGDQEKVSDINAQCSSVGASQYYRLGLARYRKTSGGGKEYQGTLGRFVQVKQLASGYGSGTIAYMNSITGAKNFSEVKADFEKAKKYAEKLGTAFPGNIKDTSWQDVTWFCWDPSWDNNGAISAYSWVTPGTAAEVGPSGADGDVYSDPIKVRDDTVDAKFKHQLGYVSPFDNGSSTYNWNFVDWYSEISVANDRTPTDSDIDSSTRIDDSGSTQFTWDGGSTGTRTYWSGPGYLGEQTYRVNVPDSGYVMVCSTIHYVPKNVPWKLDETSWNFGVDETSINKDTWYTSKACASFSKDGSTPPPDDGAGVMHFWSTSTVEGQQQEANSARSATSNNMEKKPYGHGKAELILSTDHEEVSTKYEHSMHHLHEKEDGTPYPPSCYTHTIENLVTGITTSTTYCNLDQYRDNIYTKLEVEPQSGSSVTVNLDSSQYLGNSHDSGDGGKTGKLVASGDGEEESPDPGAAQESYGSKISYEYEKVYLKKEKKSVRRVTYTLVTNAGSFDTESDITYYIYCSKTKGASPGSPGAGSGGTGGGGCSAAPTPGARPAEPDGKDKGSSEAWISIDRPELPDHTTGPSSGDASDASKPMYVGEQTKNMTWGLRANGYQTRRIMQYESIAYDVKVNRTREDRGTIGSFPAGTTNSDKAHTEDPDIQHSLKDPCNYWHNKFSGYVRECKKMDGASVSYERDGGYPNDSHTDRKQKLEQSPSLNMVVPDYTGDKYCNSVGIQWQYYYGIKQKHDSITSPTVWSKQPDVRNTTNGLYWTHYSSSCRSIAKRPSVAIWNNSIFVGNGKVTTSLAQRYDDTAIRSSDPVGDQYFGSWTEYIASVNGEIKNFSSGASLSNMSKLNSGGFNLLANSPLTISNKGVDVRRSGINNDSLSAYHQRLANYFWDDAGDGKTNELASSLNDLKDKLRSAATSNKKTIIYYHHGNLTIDDNIKQNETGEFKTIQTLPQAIIVADGNIEIKSNVSQIDAWLIAGNITPSGADGNIDTCASFTYRNTEAEVKEGLHNPKDCSGQLVINGPVIAENINLRRTYGAERWDRSAKNYDPAVNTEGTTSRPAESRAATAEVFNLSADVYLWAYAQAARYSSSYNEAYIRELPPRY